MRKIRNYLFLVFATMMICSFSVCTASAQTSGSGSGTVYAQAQDSFWSRSVTFKQNPGYYKKYKKNWSLKNGWTKKYVGTYKYYGKFSYNGSSYTTGSKTISLSRNEYKAISVRSSVANALSLIPNNSASYEYEYVSSPSWYVSKTTRCSAW
jgi:hypothetical protein